MAQGPSIPNGADPERRGVEPAFGEKISSEWVSHVDEYVPDVEDRAEEIWTLIQVAAEDYDYDLTTYNVLCFSIQFIGMLAIGELSSDEDLLPIAKVANRWLNHHHYGHARSLFDLNDPKE